MSVDMASSLPEDGIRRVSISPTDTEPESDDMEPCADPLPMEIDERLGSLGRMKFGSLQRPQSHLLPSGSPMYSGVRKSWINHCQETDMEESASIPCHNSWLVTRRHGLRLTHP